MPVPSPRRLLLTLRALSMLGLVLCLAACATATGRGDSLQRNQYAWSGAIRWGDFEGALNLVDPKVRAERPITDVELGRYQQVQISSYRDVGSDADVEAGTAARDVQIGVINKHTQVERNVRYREQWRWDEESGTWWLTTGLPDLWAGQ
ncbi:MAG: hypothetical protein M3Q40_10660 [Pseudomonadota bacterium]|nr:hypothetical protein [Pseudomonadota bacterium]